MQGSAARKGQMPIIREHPNGIVLNVLVQPRSSKNKIVGVHADALKVKVTAPPVAGAANKMCLKFLAKCLATPYFRLEIISGQNARTKQILWSCEHVSPSDKDKELLKRRVAKLIRN